MRKQRRAAEQLRTAIDCLPVETRLAMLQGVNQNDIIVGAYVDRDGGVCPMLAAHRCGGRTDFLTFARTWDRFTQAGNRARRADARELLVLTASLEASLLASEEAGELQKVIDEHKELVARRRARAAAAQAVEPVEPVKVRPGDPDRSKELAGRHGWSWLRPFRRLDEYERAVAAAQVEGQQASERERERI